MHVMNMTHIQLLNYFTVVYMLVYVLEAMDEDQRKEQLILDPFFLGRI